MGSAHLVDSRSLQANMNGIGAEHSNYAEVGITTVTRASIVPSLLSMHGEWFVIVCRFEDFSYLGIEALFYFKSCFSIHQSYLLE